MRSSRLRLVRSFSLPVVGCDVGDAIDEFALEFAAAFVGIVVGFGLAIGPA
jgi:hypothetical protein